MILKKESGYVYCHCSAYKGKGHKCGAGLCNGQEWASSVHQYEPNNCSGCNSNNADGCEVSSGQESISECQAFKSAVNGTYPEYYHPLNSKKWERIMFLKMSDYYDGWQKDLLTQVFSYLFFFVSANIIPTATRAVKIAVPPFETKVIGMPESGTTPSEELML